MGNVKKLICPQCYSKFRKVHRNQTYCSKECRRLFYKYYYRNFYKALRSETEVIKICKNCGYVVIPEISEDGKFLHKYCSKECREAYFNAYRKTEEYRKINRRAVKRYYRKKKAWKKLYVIKWRQRIKILQSCSKLKILNTEL